MDNRFVAYARLVTVTFLAVFFLAACDGRSNHQTPPLLAPIALDESKDPVTLDVQIHKRRVYLVSLRIYFDPSKEGDRERIRDVVGGPGASGAYGRDGVATPMEVRISRQDRDNRVLYYGTVNAIVNSWGGDNFTKNLLEIQLEPGRYRFEVRSVEPVVVLSRERAAIGVGFDPKVNYD